MTFQQKKHYLTISDYRGSVRIHFVLFWVSGWGGEGWPDWPLLANRSTPYQWLQGYAKGKQGDKHLHTIPPPTTNRTSNRDL